MNEIKNSQTSRNFNDLNTPINVKFSFIQADGIDGIKGINNNNVILKKKSIEKHSEHFIRKNFIKTKSEKFFNQYNYGVPRYHEFNSNNSYIKVKNFLNEKILDKEFRSPKMKKQTYQEEPYDYIDLPLDDIKIGEYKINCPNNKISSIRNNQNIDNKLKNSFNYKQKDLKLEEKDYNYKITPLNDNNNKLKNNNFFQVIKKSYKSIPKLNFDINESLNSKNFNNLKNRTFVGKNKILSNKINKIILNNFDSNRNYSKGKIKLKDIKTDNSYKNSKDFTTEISKTFRNTNNMLQNSRNEINEYEDILEDKLNKRKKNSFRDNSYDFLLEKNDKEEITNIMNKNFNTSMSNDYNITFLKMQNGREKNLAYEINRLKVGSDIPQNSKEFYLLNYNEALEKEKINDREKRIKDKHSPSDSIKNFTQTDLRQLFKRTTHGEYSKFEKEFNKNLLIKKQKSDISDDNRNFNYNFDSEKYSTAMQMNNLINFPTIISDHKNFEEILNRNVNNILERGRKLLNN